MAEILDRPVVLAATAEDFPLTKADKLDLIEIKDFIAGNDRAFLGLYARYEAPLLAYCHKMCNNSRFSEDSFQETWLRIFELRKRSVEIGRFSSVLFRTARNICLNRMRRESVRSGHNLPIEESLMSVQPKSEMEQEELRELITKALGKLPIVEREVFVLREYSGYDYAEIAVILGRTPTSIKTLAFRARTRLRKLVSGWLGLQEEKDEQDIRYMFAQKIERDQNEH